ncbi:MAG: hypothetical protein MUC51_19510 [Anaerolineae bacterium]|nr:hypothetical protein [Anaerolineae bacterium]
MPQIEEMRHHLPGAARMIRPHRIQLVFQVRSFTDQHHRVAPPDDLPHLFNHVIMERENDQQPIDAATQHSAHRFAFAMRVQRRVDEQDIIT